MIRFANSLILLILCTFMAQAQDDSQFPGPGPGKGPMREKMIEKMESMRVAYLTNKLDLTTEESTRFWPVYNEYARKRMELRRDMMEEKRDIRSNKLTDKESQDAVDNQFKIQEQELVLKRNYYDKFKAILPSQKLAKLEPAEMEFNHEVIQKLKERRERRMGGKGRF